MKIFKRVLAILLISLAILLAASFITLKRGISISELSISNTQINNTHLIWDNKLKLKIESIAVQPTKEKASKKSFTGAKPSYVRDALRAVNLIEEWFTSIDIKQIRIGSLNAGFRYRENEEGQLTVNSPQLDIQAKISTDAEFLLVDIKNISSPEYKSHAEGKVRVDTNNRKLAATFEVMIADTLPLQLEVKADRTQLSFSGHGKQSVTSIAPIVEVFDLDPDITPWISEYLTASQISLTSVSGSIPYDQPASILQTLHAVANVKDTEYTFAQGLEPIKAKETEVTFEKGVLKIKPRNASFYQQDAGNSELDINFNNSPFILTAYIRTKAQASGGILTLLDFYGIPFPFEQKQGLVDTDLTLAINLSTIDIKADGVFKSEDNIFEYDEQLFEVDQLDVRLKNTDITLNRIDIRKGKLFSAHIKGELDAAKSRGDLQATIDSFSYQSDDTEIRLANPSDAPLKLAYSMRPDGDTLHLPASRWKAGDVDVEIGEISTAFDHRTLHGDLSSIPVNVSPWFKSTVSGSFNRQPPYADLKVSLHEFKHESFSIDQPDVIMEIVIGKDISLITKSETRLKYGETSIKLMPTKLIYGDNKLHLKQSGLQLAGVFVSDITGLINLNTQTGKLDLNKLKIDDKTGSPILAVNETLPLHLSFKDYNTSIAIPLLGIEYQQKAQNGWSLKLNDLSKLNKFSPFMQDYELDKGEVELTSMNGSMPYSFTGKLTYPHAILIDATTPIHDYSFNGRYQEDKTTIDINDTVQISIADKVAISAKNIGFNLPALFKFKDKKIKPDKKDKPEKKALSLGLKANNSFLFLSEKNRILADEIHLSDEQGVISGDLEFGDGFASMEIKDKQLSLIGKKFSEEFINGLLVVSKLKKGELEFEVSGELDNLNAVILINDAILTDYGLANNVLAFINTVPSLITFRVPDFHNSGLHARKIKAGLNYQNGLINLKSLHLDSKEIDLRGEGTVDLNNDTIDVTLNLITGTKKSVGRIPLLGYVLSGDKKKPSITLTVKGDLHEPEIKHTAFKEVASYPMKLLKRTIILPGHLVNKVNKETSDNKAESEDELYQQ
jgi:hypothetical protein